MINNLLRDIKEMVVVVAVVVVVVVVWQWQWQWQWQTGNSLPLFLLLNLFQDTIKRVVRHRVLHLSLPRGRIGDTERLEGTR